MFSKDRFSLLVVGLFIAGLFVLSLPEKAFSGVIVGCCINRASQPKNIERISEKQVADIKAFVSEFSKDGQADFHQWFKSNFNLTEISKLPVHSYEDVIRGLENKRKLDANQ